MFLVAGSVPYLSSPSIPVETWWGSCPGVVIMEKKAAVSNGASLRQINEVVDGVYLYTETRVSFDWATQVTSCSDRLSQ